MSKPPSRELAEIERHWRSATHYVSLLHADRRGFAWEWLRRHEPYCKAWVYRDRLPGEFGLLAYENPGNPLPFARPIWSPEIDPAVLASQPVIRPRMAEVDMLDIRNLTQFVSVEVDDRDVECWLFTDGQWAIRLDLHDGTLLGGPVRLQHRLEGFASAEPTALALRKLGALASRGKMPAVLLSREPRAARWVLELRTADAMASGASHQEMARTFFSDAIGGEHWRSGNPSFRLRIQRLVRAAKRHLADPFAGPWFR